MITCERSCTYRSSLRSRASSATASACTPSSSASGTPVYIYSARAIRDAYRAIDAAFAGYPHAIHYALKANSTLAIVRLLRSLGSRADANSGGEIAGGAARRLRAARHRLHRRRQDARRARDAPSPTASARSTPSRPASSIASRQLARGHGPRRARRAARQSRHRRAEPPQHLHRPQDQQVRRAAAGCARHLPRAPPRCRACGSSACTSTSDRRSPPPNRCARAAERAGRRWRWSCATTASASSTWISAAASASPTKDGR